MTTTAPRPTDPTAGNCQPQGHARTIPVRTLRTVTSCDGVWTLITEGQALYVLPPAGTRWAYPSMADAIPIEVAAELAERECKRCNGSGRLGFRACPHCHGQPHWRAICTDCGSRPPLYDRPRCGPCRHAHETAAVMALDAWSDADALFSRAH